MGKQFEHRIENVTFVTQRRLTCRVAPLADILLIAEAVSDRIGSLVLSIRFRTMHDAQFAQIDVPGRILRKDYPKGYDPKDPAKLLAQQLTLKLKPSGKYTLVCGSYKAEGRIRVSLDPFLQIVREPAENKRQTYTRKDVDDDTTCIPPI